MNRIIEILFKKILNLSILVNWFIFIGFIINIIYYKKEIKYIIKIVDIEIIFLII